jgi:hypothetical protein
VLAAFTPRHLEVAAAWISPILGLATVVFLSLWGAMMKLPYRRAMVLLVVVSPICAHGFQVGRPDHQAIQMLLVAVALAAEVGIWLKRSPAWAYVSATAWAVALWVSLFEPLILLALILAARLFARLAGRLEAPSPNGSSFFPRHKAIPLLLFLGILATAFLIDGWRPVDFHPAFDRWAMNIGELKGAGWSGLFSWCGWLLPVVPLFLIVQWIQGRAALCGLFALLVVAMAGLSFYHARWGYFLLVVFAMSLPWVMTPLLFRWRWLAAVAFIVSLWPMAAEWERILYPNDEAFRARVETIADSVALREVGLALRELPEGAVMAPWWLSPALVWWSGRPCVGGTSHQSLPGIVDSCEFYLASDPASAQAILERRRVKYILTYEPDRVTSNSEQILGKKAVGKPMADVLYHKPEQAPEDWMPVFSNRFFRIHQVREPNP